MSNSSSSRAVGVGRVLIAVYAILALATTARSVFQIVTKFDEAPAAYLLSAAAALVYVVATAALVGRGQRWYIIAWATIIFELAGVLVIGLLSLFDASVFPADTVWSGFGRGYAFIPLVLPVLGLLWLYRTRPNRAAA